MGWTPPPSADPARTCWRERRACSNIANVAPRRATLYRDTAEAAAISIEIELSGAVIADMIRRKLEQLTPTLDVSVIAGDRAD
jgi:hypothetical protein